MNVDPLSTANIVALCLAAAFLFVSAFISGSEIAFFQLSPRFDDEIEESSRRASIERLLDEPDRLLSTILIANNVVNVAIVMLATFGLSPVFASIASPVVSFIVQTVILTFLILLFGEILPKLVANNAPLRWAEKAAAGMVVATRLCHPFSSILMRSTRVMNHVATSHRSAVTADELTQALEITRVSPNESDREMLAGILTFGEKTASAIMTPRVDITDLDIELTFDEVVKIVIQSGYSRLPVYEDNQDNIRGVLYARDLLPYIHSEDIGDFRWQSLLRDPYFVPESRMIDDLLEDFRRLKLHMAIVVDEFGGTQGLVTLEDVLEEIVGDISDEYDDDEKFYKRIGDNTFIFEGKTLLTDFFRVTGLDADDYEPVAENAETLAGMLLAVKGDFPKEKEPLVYGRCRFLVLDIDHHRIAEVRVKVMDEVQTS